MDIQKRTETKDVFTAAFGMDSLKQVAIGALKRELKIEDGADGIVCEADFDDAKGIVVTIEVTHVDAPGSEAKGQDANGHLDGGSPVASEDAGGSPPALDAVAPTIPSIASLVPLVGT